MARLPRYPIARTVTRELERQRAGAIRPAEAAREELVKAGAFVTALGAVGKVAEGIAEASRIREQEDDKIKVAQNESFREIAYEQLKSDIENDPELRDRFAADPEALDEYFLRETQAIEKTYKDVSEKITNPETKARYQKLQQIKLAEFRNDALADLNAYKTTAGKDRSSAGMIRALAKDRPDLARTELAAGRNFFDEKEEAQWERLIQVAEDEAKARQLFGVYDEIEDKEAYLLELAERDLDPEVERRLMALVDQDLRIRRGEIKKLATMEKAERAIRIIDYRENDITIDTTDAEIFNFSRENDITDHGTIGTFFTQRQQLIDDAAVSESDWLDHTDLKTRESYTRNINALTNDKDERVRIGIGLAITEGVASTNLEAYFESPDGPEQAENYRIFREGAPLVHLPLSDNRRSLYDLYAVNRRGGADPGKAYSLASEVIASATPEIREVREKEYYAASGFFGDAINDRLREQFTKALKDVEGMYIPSRFFANDAPVMPPEMAMYAETIARSTYQITGSEPAALKAMVDAVPNVGWRATEINRGVTSGEEEMDWQYKQYPPPRGREWTRKVLANDLKTKQFWHGGELKTFDSSQIEIYEYEPDPETGEQHWTMRVDGVILLGEDRQPAWFTPVPMEEVKIEKPDIETLLKAHEKAQAELVKQREEQQRHARLPLTGVRS